MSAPWLLDTLVATGLLLAAVILLRAPVRALCGAGAAYALWALPALRLLLPPLPAPMAAVAAPLDVVPTLVVQPASAPAGAAPALLTLWAAGALGFLLWQIVAYRLFAARVLSGAEFVGRHDGIELLRSPAVDGPIALGFFERGILLPADWEARYSPAERLLALRHEAMHHARLDLWANALALGLLALHWFNPLGHWAYRLFRRDQELACDAAVVGGADADTRERYARALVKTAAPGPPAPNLSATLIHGPDLKRRVTMLHQHKTRRSPVGALVVSALTFAGLGLTATGGIAQTAADAPAKVERIVIKRAPGANPEAELSKALGGRCAGVTERFETEAETVQDGKPVKTRLILCEKEGASGDRLTRLEKARERLSGLADLEPENRAKITAALDQAIARLKAGQ